MGMNPLISFNVGAGCEIVTLLWESGKGSIALIDWASRLIRRKPLCYRECSLTGLIP